MDKFALYRISLKTLYHLLIGVFKNTFQEFFNLNFPGLVKVVDSRKD